MGLYSEENALEQKNNQYKTCRENHELFEYDAKKKGQLTKQLPRLWEYDSPPPTSYFFDLRENFLGKKIGGQWAKPQGKFRHFQNEKLEFYNKF